MRTRTPRPRWSPRRSQRIAAETPEEAERATAVWLSDESRAARAAQRQKLGMKE